MVSRAKEKRKRYTKKSTEKETEREKKKKECSKLEHLDIIQFSFLLTYFFFVCLNYIETKHYVNMLLFSLFLTSYFSERKKNAYLNMWLGSTYLQHPSSLHSKLTLYLSFHQGLCCLSQAYW
jgi:dolichol kinase